MIKSIFLILSLSLTASLLASVETKLLMRDVLENYLKLLPSLYEENNVEEMKTRLDNLDKSFEKAGHNKMLTRSNFSPSLKVMSNSFKEIKNTLNNKNYNFAAYRTKKVVSTCISCHSQLPKPLYPKVETGYASLINTYVRTDFEKGLFSYMLRDYERAIKFLKQDFEKSLKNKDGKYKSEDILKTILKIYIVNLDDVENAKKYYFRLKNRNDINKNLKETISTWYESLNNYNEIKGKNINEYIAKHLKPIESEIKSSYIHENDVAIFKMQSMLNKYSFKKGQKNEAEIMYWLGMIENREDSIYLTSLGDLYLKECVEKYPRSKQATKCLKAYEDSLTFSFTGSAGTSIPPEVQKEISRLKKLIK